MPSSNSVEAWRASLVFLLHVRALCCSACPLMRVARLKALLNGC